MIFGQWVLPLRDLRKLPFTVGTRRGIVTNGSETLSGKRVLISGASSGVGRATASLFASAGAMVGLIARREHLLRELALSLGDSALALPADVADDRAVAGVVTQFVQRFGGIDIVINGAGVIVPRALKDLTPAIWRRHLDVNLSGTFYLSREAALHMLAAEGGSIITIGSELSLVGMALTSDYCAAKAGVVGLTRALAVELAPKIRVNCLCPGPIDTPMMDEELATFPDPAAARQQAIERVPLKRFASPAEVARAIQFLAVDAPFATGSIFSLDGGTTTA
jgi:NAD(P)-dependent dehydrogenase (short-subunit alcohol dehydrogenase family)